MPWDFKIFAAASKYETPLTGAADIAHNAVTHRGSFSGMSASQRDVSTKFGITTGLHPGTNFNATFL